MAAAMKTVDGAEEMYVAEAKVLRGAKQMAIVLVKSNKCHAFQFRTEHTNTEE